MHSKLLSGLVVAGLVAFTPRAEANPFPIGSLILPASASYQSDCGSVGVYGLVYDVLRANAWLASHGYGAITINYAIADSTLTTWSPNGKLSPNRCIPSNLHTAPVPSADPSWNDGCDFQLTGAAPLVKLVNNNNTSAAGDTNVTTYSTIGNNNVWPQYTNLSLATATTIGYLGGPFIISAAPTATTLGSDAATLLKLVDGGLVAQDSAGNNIDFSPFKNPPPNAAGQCRFGSEAYVNIHRAKVGFTATISIQFNSAPPRLALLNTGDGLPAPQQQQLEDDNRSPFGATESGTTATFQTKNAHGFLVGQTVVVSGVKDNRYNGTYVVASVPSPVTFTVTGMPNGLGNSGKGNATLNATAEVTGGVSGGILPNYLNDAGLGFPGAQGCPSGGINIGDHQKCPIGGNPGQIFDTFDFADLVSGQLVIADNGVQRYSMIWAPHWDTTANGGTGPNLAEQQALTNISTFLDGQTGLFAECAAVESIEGSYQNANPNREAFTGIQLQTCQAAAGVCTGQSAYGIGQNVSNAPSGPLKNCTDVTTTAGSNCAYFSYPQDRFAQTADYLFSPTGGSTHDWNPNASTSSMYKPGVLTLVSGVVGLVPANLVSAAQMRSSGMIVTDWFTRNIKDNTIGKGNVAYLGGHDLTGEVSAVKLVLQTLLQLGAPVADVLPVITEVSRASPIVTTLNNNPVIVQGTFESLVPAPPVPVIDGANAIADVAIFSFPVQHGHMRATDASSITTAGQAFGKGTVEFDAANGIPNVTNAGCATPFDGTCRTIFTTTAVSGTGVTRNPPNVFFQDGNSDLLGSLMAPGLAPPGNPYWVTMVERVLSGVPDGNGGYNPGLGGVDRSTVAVIEPSTVAGVARPTMVYFGATDGMLHAVCATVTAPACDVLGRELWAFMPRTQLPLVRLNTTRIDGSPHVADVFGDFTGSGVKSFRTILTFQTGSGTAVVGATPAVYALDITDPTNPTVIWEYTAPTVPGAVELGTGLAMAGGPVQNGGAVVNLAFAETNNGGLAPVTNGVVLSAINVETGAQFFKFSAAYTPLRLAGDAIVPANGIPGGAVAIDKTLQGFTTDVVFGDLFGRVWMVDPATGLSRYFTGLAPPTAATQEPLFSFTTDFHAIGAMPAIYSDGSSQFAVIVSGGFDSSNDVPWIPLAGAPPAQSVVAMSLNTLNAGAVLPAQNAPLNETMGLPNVPFSFAIAGSGFAQATIVGGQLFFTTDNGDVNASGYGLGAPSGNMYAYTIGAPALGAAVVVAGGAGSIANVGTTLYSSTSNQQAQINAPATSTAGPSVDGATRPQISRKLWLRTL